MLAMSKKTKRLYFGILTKEKDIWKIEVHLITKTLSPEWIMQIKFNPGMTRGQDTELVQALIDNTFEQIRGWSNSSYWGEQDWDNLPFSIFIKNY